MSPPRFSCSKTFCYNGNQMYNISFSVKPDDDDLIYDKIIFGFPVTINLDNLQVFDGSDLINSSKISIDSDDGLVITSNFYGDHTFKFMFTDENADLVKDHINDKKKIKISIHTSKYNYDKYNVNVTKCDEESEDCEEEPKCDDNVCLDDVMKNTTDLDSIIKTLDELKTCDDLECLKKRYAELQAICAEIKKQKTKIAQIITFLGNIDCYVKKN